MKICFIHNLYPPYARGGAERVVEHQVAEHKKQGDDVVVITLASWQSIREWGVKKKVENKETIYYLAVPNICSYMNISDHSWLTRLLWHIIDIWNISAVHIIYKILKTEKPDIISTHNLMGLGFLLPHTVQRLGIKHIHTVHDVQLISPSGILPWNHKKDTLFEKGYQIILKYRFQKIDECIFPSVFLQNFYEVRGFFCQVKKTIQYNFYPIHFSHLKIKQPPYRHFLYVGGLEKHKGIHILFDAWESVQKIAALSLSFVGDGALRQEVEDWTLKDLRVQAPGRLDMSLLEFYYNKSDVLIFPSICIENSPNVLYEAMTHGLYIIASDTGGVRELIGGYSGITLVEPGNVKVLTEEMKKIIYI